MGQQFVVQKEANTWWSNLDHKFPFSCFHSRSSNFLDSRVHVLEFKVSHCPQMPFFGFINSAVPSFSVHTLGPSE